MSMALGSGHSPGCLQWLRVSYVCPHVLLMVCQKVGDLLTQGSVMSQVLQLGDEFGGDYRVKC